MLKLFAQHAWRQLIFNLTSSQLQEHLQWPTHTHTHTVQTHDTHVHTPCITFTLSCCIIILCRCSLLLQTEERGLSQSWALQKRLNQSRCHLGCGLAWAQGNMMGVRIPTRRSNFLAAGELAHPEHAWKHPAGWLSRGQHRYSADADWSVLDD